MHAIRLHAFGPPEVLVLDELEDLAPAAGQERLTGGYAEQAVTAVDSLFPVADHVAPADAVAAVGTDRTALGVRRPRGPAGAGQGGPGVGRLERTPMNPVDLVGPLLHTRRHEEDVIDLLIAGAVHEAPTGRATPRALRPFRHAAYRRLALALVFSTFASGVWVVALVWEVIRIGGGPAQLSVVSTAGGRRRARSPPSSAASWPTGWRRSASCCASPPSS